jgi:hypothetical protein
MADGEEQQTTSKLPQVNYLAVSQDDYMYESKPLPRRVVEELSRGQQTGGMASQFEIVSSGLKNNA